MVLQVKVIVEKHSDEYVAYPLGLKGVVVGEGNTYEEALNDVNSAIGFHIDTFGNEVFEDRVENAAYTLAHETIILQATS